MDLTQIRWNAFSIKLFHGRYVDDKRKGKKELQLLMSKQSVDDKILE